MARTVSAARGARTVFNPTAITGLKGWYKADAISQADSTAVSSWADSSGTGNTATQGTGALQPTFLLNIQNGLPAVRCVSQYLATGSFTALAQPNTLFVVGKLTDTVSSYRFFDGITSGGRQVLFRAAGGTWQASAGTAIDSGITADTSPHLFTVSFHQITGSTTSNIRIDCAVKKSSASNTQNPTGFTLGANFDGTSPLKGNIYEILFYNASLSQTDIDQVERYLSFKWGLSTRSTSAARTISA